MVCQIYPTELQLDKVNSSDNEAPFLDFKLVHNKWHSSYKIYNKWDGFNFEIVNFPILDGEMLLASLPMVYMFLSLFVL